MRARGVSSILRAGDQLAPGTAVENLSLGGAFLRTPTPMSAGTRVVLDLMKPELPKAIRLAGRVVNTVSPGESKARGQPPGMGIQFDPLSVDAERRLRELLLLIAADPAAIEGDRTQEIGKAIELSLLEPETIEPEPLEPELLPEADEPLTLVEPGAASPRASSLALAPAATASLDAAAPMSDSARLMVQVKGLLMELSEWQTKVNELEREKESLRETLSAEWRDKLDALQQENDSLREELTLVREALARR